MLATRVNDIETEDTAALSFEMASGALVTSSVTLGGAQDHSRLRLVFQNLTAESSTQAYAPASGDWHFAARGAVSQAKIDAVTSESSQLHEGFAGYLEDVAKALNGAPSGAVTLADGRASIELITAIYAAARTGQRIALPLSSDHALYEGWMP